MINQKFVIQDLNNIGHVKFSRGRRMSLGKYGVTDDEFRKYKARQGSKEELSEIGEKLWRQHKREFDRMVKQYRPLEPSLKKLIHILHEELRWYKKWRGVFVGLTGEWEVKEFTKKLEDFGYWPYEELWR